MSLMYRQKTTIDAGPNKGNGVITKDVSIADTTEIGTCEEALYQRLKLAPGEYLEIKFNSIDTAQAFFCNFTEVAELHLKNDQGDVSVPIKVYPNRLSVMHFQLSGLYVKNLSNNTLEGYYYIIGD